MTIVTKTARKAIILAAVMAVGSWIHPGRSYASEQALVGVPIYSSARTVLRKYGNPTLVLTDGQVFNGAQNTVGTAPAVSNAGGAFGLGALPALAPNGAPPPQQAPQQAAPSSSSTTGNPGEVTYVYQFNNGLTYEFLFSPAGHVVQITVLGYTGSQVRTGRGITLGSSYSTVVDKYGYPEYQERDANSITVVRYDHRAHVAFQLQDKVVDGVQSTRVIGIVIGAVN